mgnify:CR=1 FL=1
MTDNECMLFETNLLKKYQSNPNAELAETLIKEYSAHIFNKTDCTKELQVYIDKILADYSKNEEDLSQILGLDGKWGRSKIEIKYILMNAQTWRFIFEGKSLSDAYKETSELLSISIDDVRIGFERKNHDFGSRELSRFGLDIFIALNRRHLSSEEIQMANVYLKENVNIQMFKDLDHHRVKYK